MTLSTLDLAIPSSPLILVAIPAHICAAISASFGVPCPSMSSAVARSPSFSCSSVAKDSTSIS